MTATDLMPLLGQCALWHPPHYDLGVSVRILDARRVFARVDCLITPCAGRGDCWVGRDALTLIPEKGTTP